MADMISNEYLNIPKDKFTFVNQDERIHDRKFDDKDSLQFCLDFCERGQRRLKKDSLQHKGYLK